MSHACVRMSSKSASCFGHAHAFRGTWHPSIFNRNQLLGHRRAPPPATLFSSSRLRVNLHIRRIVGLAGAGEFVHGGGQGRVVLIVLGVNAADAIADRDLAE